jgi:spermidine synthase
MRTLSGIGLFSVTVLLFQVTLTRLFSIAQFYHFAFLVVSLALLGFGASGSILAVWPRLRSASLRPVYALGFAPATVGAYIILNRWSFDSYAIAWDREQVWRLLANLFCLAVPFTLAGALVGAFLADQQLSAGRVYGANMIGSALGAAAAPLLLAWIGDERIIVLCSAVAALAALLLIADVPHARVLAAVSGIVLAASTVGLVFPPGVLEIQPSPYKAISTFRRNPDATIESPRYNAYSRLDIVHSPSIHSAPGISITYFSAPPPEIGLLIDGDNLMPVVEASAAPSAFAAAMPASIAFGLYQDPKSLVLGAGGGLDAWVALANGAGSVVAVGPNSLIYDALRHSLRDWSGLAGDPRVELVHQEIRTYARQSQQRFDIVQLGLTDTYRPVTSGAFTLTENYTLTVEAFREYLGLLDRDGVLVVTRWLQTPPSEELRTFGLIVAALDARGLDPETHVVAFRSFLTATFLVKASPFTPDEVDRILAGAERLKYDMIVAPNLPPETVNRYARLPEPVYYTTFNDLLNAKNRDAFYDSYDFDVRPPTDDHPFFFHFFKWRQTPDILNKLGRTWQPFGGSGYFVLVALLIFALIAALVFVVLPLALPSRFRAAIRQTGTRRSARIVVYFGSLGLAYLLIEVATIQQFVLILGQPTLAIATVLATLLLFSGIGSTLSDRLPWARMLAALVVLLLAWPWILHALAGTLLALPLVARLPLSVLTLAPLGLLMGIPFARGVTAIHYAPGLIAWAWAINGGASVVSAVLAALLALSFGFTWVLWIGGALYGAAWISRPILSRA